MRRISDLLFLFSNQSPFLKDPYILACFFKLVNLIRAFPFTVNQICILQVLGLNRLNPRTRYISKKSLGQFTLKSLINCFCFSQSKPSFGLGWQTLSHAITDSSPFILDFFQKNCVLHLSICFLVCWCNSKHTSCVESNSKCDWIRIILPSLDKKFAFQTSSLVVALLIIS